MRKGDWKLLSKPRDTSEVSVRQKDYKAPKRFLVNLQEDVGEKVNLAENHPEVVKELEKIHEQWVKTFPKETK